ncbi:MAG: hypothetical protein ABWZ99_16325 [Ilumatobacteraceae bacterium]
MPVVDINPNNSGTIMLGLTAIPTQDYACQVINFLLEPVANTTERAGTFCSAPATINAASSWQVSFQYLQDWGAANSISQFFFDNDGQEVFFSFAPDVTDVPTASGSFNCMAGSYGGDAGSSWDFSGTCGLVGTPTFTPPVAALAAEEVS